jgi:hypothetical protein
MPRHPNAPDPRPLLQDILGPDAGGPDLWKRLPAATQTRAAGLTRGDLMRAGGWATRRPILDSQGNPHRDPQGNIFFSPEYAISPTLLQITTDDIREINQLLQEFNDRDYGTGVYFCCCCV